MEVEACCECAEKYTAAANFSNDGCEPDVASVAADEEVVTQTAVKGTLALAFDDISALQDIMADPVRRETRTLGSPESSA